MTMDIKPSFASGGPSHTHQFIVAQAIYIINNDKGYEVSKPLFDNAKTLMNYSDMPDTDEKGPLIFPYLHHFYNPFTDKNYIGGKITARTKFVEHALAAKKIYSTNKNQSMEELGRACHFLSDINVPHHVSNLVAIFSNHTQYEDWLDNNLSTYAVTSYNDYNKLSIYSFENFCNIIAYKSACNAYQYRNEASSRDKSQWGISAKAILPHAQKITAHFLYRFLVEVGQIDVLR